MSYNVFYNYGDYAGPGPSYFQAWVGARVAEESATHVRIEGGQAVWATDDFGGTYVNTSGSDGQGGATLYGAGWYADTSWHDMGWYERGSSVYLWCHAWYVGGSGREYKSMVEGSWTVPYVERPNPPSLSASKTAIVPGEKVTIDIAGSANASAQSWFDHYTVTDGMGKTLLTFTEGNHVVGSVPNASLTVDPWAILQEYGINEYASGCNYVSRPYDVAICVQQAHEFYGTYPASDWAAAVINVKTGTIAAYDASGARCSGLVTAYDARGKPCPMLITAYDAEGKRRDIADL